MTIELSAVTALALQKITLSLRSGELVLVVGQTGAGKSTLLRTICGLEPLQAGSIRVDDIDLWQKKRVQAAALHQLTMVFQSPEQQLFASTVQKEFEYSLRPLRLDDVESNVRTLKALEQVGMPPSVRDISPKALSGGQQRRIALGTALATKPKWLLLDEPTAGLDALAAHALSCDLRQMANQGSGIIVATHDLDVWLPLADRIIGVKAGHVVLDAPKAQIKECPEALDGVGIGLPAATECAVRLNEFGWDVPRGVQSPKEVAAYLANAICAPQMNIGSEKVFSAGTMREHLLSPERKDLTSTEDVRSQKTIQPISEVDARAKWLAYALLSVAFVAMPLQGLLPSTVLAAGLVYLFRVQWRRIWSIARPFLWFMAFAVAFSGLQWPIGYSTAAGLRTLLSLYRILLILVLGVLFTSLTSTLEMKRGLEAAMRWMKPLKVPVEAIAFGVSIVLRFIPVLAAETKKFAEVAQVRAKRIGRPGQVRLRDAPSLLLPLLFCVFQLGEDLSFAMETRGLQRFGMPRTSSAKATWEHSDTGFVLSALALTVALILLAVGLKHWL